MPEFSQVDLEIGGSSSATAGQILKADGSGGTDWVNNTAALASVDSANFSVFTSTNLQDYLDENDTLVLKARSTGLLSGGALTDLGSGVVRIAAGEGQIVDNTIPSAPVYTNVTWAQTDIDLAAIGDNRYWIYVNNASTVTYTTTEPSHSDYRTDIYLHRVVIRSGSVSGQLSVGMSTQQYAGQIWDIWRAFPLVKDGLSVTDGGSGTVNIGAGEVYSPGISQHTDALNPNERSYNAVSGVTFRHIDRNNVQTADRTIVDVNNYDLAGVITPTPNNKWVIFAWYMFGTLPANHRVLYPQTLYNTKEAAREALYLGLYAPQVPSNLDDAYRLGWIIVEKGDTNLSAAIFVTSNEFGGVGGAVASAPPGYVTEDGAHTLIGTYDFTGATVTLNSTTVQSAGALMDSELTDIVSVKAFAKGNATQIADGTADKYADAKLLQDELRPRFNRKSPVGGRYISTTGELTATAGNYNFGLFDFGIFIDLIALDDYTPSSAGELWSSHSTGNNRVVLSIQTDGVWRLTFTDNAAASTSYDITPTVAFVDGQSYSIGITFDRDGLATLYVDGFSNGSVSISAEADVNIGLSNSNSGEWMTDSNISGVLSMIVPTWIVPSAAQCKQIYYEGIESWVNRSQTLPLMNFDDTDDRVEVSGMTASASYFGACTIAANIYLDSTATAINMFWALGQDSYRCYESSGTIFVNTTNTSVSFTAFYNKVTHVAVDYDASGNATALRINGTQVWTGSAVGVNPNTTFRIGSNAANAAPTIPTNLFKGTIFNFSISGSAVKNFAFNGRGNTDGDWLDLVGANNGSVQGSPALWSGVSQPFAVSINKLNEGIGFQCHDYSLNDYSLIATETGVFNLVSNERGKIGRRTQNFSASGLWIGTRNIIPEDCVIRTLILDRRIYTTANINQDVSLRRIYVNNAAGTLTFSRTSGTGAGTTLFTATPSSAADVDVTIIFERVQF